MSLFILMVPTCYLNIPTYAFYLNSMITFGSFNFVCFVFFFYFALLCSELDNNDVRARGVSIATRDPVASALIDLDLWPKVPIFDVECISSEVKNVATFPAQVCNCGVLLYYFALHRSRQYYQTTFSFSPRWASLYVFFNIARFHQEYIYIYISLFALLFRALNLW